MRSQRVLEEPLREEFFRHCTERELEVIEGEIGSVIWREAADELLGYLDREYFSVREGRSSSSSSSA